MDKAMSALRAAVGSLRNEEQALLEIARTIAGMAKNQNGDQKKRRLDWVYAMAVIYGRQTGLMPAFTNSDNETRFERFISAVNAPSGLCTTPNQVKAAIRQLKFKQNPDFARDVSRAARP